MATTTADGLPRVHPPQPDEVPIGVPKSRPGPDEIQAERAEDGRQFVSGPGTRALASLGGKAAAENRRIEALAGFYDAPPDHPWADYGRLAREWRQHHARRLADTVGGGEVGPGPLACIATASMLLAASRSLHDEGSRTGDKKLFAESAKLAAEMRQQLLVAHELCAKEAVAKAKQKAGGPAAPWLEPDATPELVGKRGRPKKRGR